MIEITKIVCDMFGIHYDDIFKKTRKREIVQVRQITTYFIRKNLKLNLVQIASFFNQNHATIFHSCKAVKNEMETNYNFNETIIELDSKIRKNDKRTIAYIAHPVSGDLEGNIDKILKIVREINNNEEKIVPFVPYLADILAMDDNDPEERKKGISNNTVYLKSGIVNELRVYGDFISKGVAEEIAIARQLNIPVIYYN